MLYYLKRGRKVKVCFQIIALIAELFFAEIASKDHIDTNLKRVNLHIGLNSKVIPFKLSLDMVPGSSADNVAKCALHGYFFVDDENATRVESVHVSKIRFTGYWLFLDSSGISETGSNSHVRT